MAKTGLTFNAIKAFEEGGGLHQGNYEVYCSALGLDPATGEAKTERIIRGKKKVGGKTKRAEKKDSAFANKQDFIPDEIDFYESEARIVLSARKSEIPLSGLKTLMILNHEAPELVECVMAIIEHKYVKAATICLAMAERDPR